MSKKKFLVIGLGRFGSSVLKELHRLGNEVVGCDANPKAFDDAELQENASFLVEGDAVSPSVLEELNVREYDSVIVSIGDDFESAILIVLALKEIGCTSIYAKANDQKRGKGLQAAGATKVVFPEEETGKRVAKYIANPDILQYVELAPHFSGIEITVPEEFIGQSLSSLDFRRNFHALVLLIKNPDSKQPIISPHPTYIFEKGDQIFLVGDDKHLEKLRKKWQ